MEPIKFEVSISVNVDLSQGTKDFLLNVLKHNFSAKPAGPTSPDGKPLATEAIIEAEAMNEAASEKELTRVAEAEKEAIASVEAAVKAEPAKVVSIEDVRAALASKVNDHREAIKAKLDEFGAPSVTKLNPSKYEEMLNFLKSL